MTPASSSGFSSDQKGAIAESAIVHAAIKIGIGVLRPLSDGERYDLILDLRPQLVRVQCKWAQLRGDVVRVRCYSCRRTADGQLKRRYTADQVDAIAAYCADLDLCLYVPIGVLGPRATLQLRRTTARNNQQLGINWVDDFAFERLRSGVPGP